MNWIFVVDLLVTHLVLVSGCTHKHVNRNLERNKLLYIFMLIYQMMVEGTLYS